MAGNRGGPYPANEQLTVGHLGSGNLSQPRASEQRKLPSKGRKILRVSSNRHGELEGVCIQPYREGVVGPGVAGRRVNLAGVRGLGDHDLASRAASRELALEFPRESNIARSLYR